MKKILKLTALFLAVITVSACQKENANRLIIEAEGMNGSKLAINGNTSYWASGDRVHINGQEFDVIINNGQASVNLGENSSLSAPYYGIYPASIFHEISTSNTDNFILSLPHDYEYATCNDGMQNLQSPMLAYQSGTSNKLFFKHFTGALAVEITNNFGYDVSVTGITVSSNKYKLSGLCEYGKESIANVGVVGGVAATCEENLTELEKLVRMYFNQTTLTIASGEMKTVQIPVLPVGSDNRFTITVTVQSLFDPSKVYTFTKTQAGNSQDGYTLARAQIGYAPAKFGGVFSVASGRTVRFSPGNLQYHAPTQEAPNGTWRFAGNQYDIIGSSNSNISDSYNGWIDLFGWGTGNAPTQSSTNNADYSTFTDWGTNVISDNSANTWRTLTKDEWVYLFNRDHKWAKATVSSINGYIILPDDFEDPMVRDGNQAIYFTEAHSWYNQYTAENWIKMEAAGAIFLPIAGERSGTTPDINFGHYWSSTSDDNSKANKLYFTIEGFSYTSTNRSNGCSVRLVRTN